MIHSKLLTSFHIAGFKYYDGLYAINQLAPGDLLELVAVPENPYDPDAVALTWDGMMLGYVPRYENGLLAQMLRFGHDDVFEARVQAVDPKADIYEQVRVGIYFTDAT